MLENLLQRIILMLMMLLTISSRVCDLKDIFTAYLRTDFKNLSMQMLLNHKFRVLFKARSSAVH